MTIRLSYTTGVLFRSAAGSNQVMVAQISRSILGRALFGMAVLFSFWATWRWVDVFSADPALGAEAERRARVLELTCSTIAALAATGFSSRYAFRRDLSDWLHDTNPQRYGEDADRPVRNREPEGPTVNLRASDVVELPLISEPASDGGIEEISRSIAARMATEKCCGSPPTAGSAVSDAGEPQRSGEGAANSHRKWTRLAMASLENELMLINGFTDLLLSGHRGSAAEDLLRIRCAGERSVLLVQQFPLFEDQTTASAGSLDLNELISRIRPRFVGLVSHDTDITLSLHSQGVCIKADADGLTLAICALVAEANRISEGCGSIRIATGAHAISIETKSSHPGERYNLSPGCQATETLVATLGGSLAVSQKQGLISFRVSLPPS